MSNMQISGIASSYNASPNNYYDVPTNPKLTLGSYATGDKLFTIIYEDGSITNDTIERPVSSGDIHEEYSNLHNTNGFSIRCFDNATNTGVNLSSINLTNNEYYVLINSNESNLYHFAKITSIGTADVQGDKFEFSPRLGNEVAKGVKFKVFKGPSNTDKIIAVSAGIDKDISLLNIARPYFYFYNDKLDKKNELNHNTKYMLKSNETNSSVNSIAIQTNTSIKHSFTTVADHRYKIIDYSKFTYNIKLEDKLKLLDDPNTATSNESTLLSSTYAITTNYNNSFVNARRDVNDDASSLDLTGPKRYVYYKFSPEDNNRMPNVYECNIADSFDAKAGYASLKLIDSTKNLSNKVFNNDRLFVNQKLSEENLNDWVEVATIDSLVNLGQQTFSLAGKVERPNLYFSATNEIKIGDRICIVKNTSSTHDIRLELYSRLTTESIFTITYMATVGTFTNGTKVYRRRLNPIDNTFFTETNISASKLEKLNAVILSNQYTNFYCRMGSFISNVDEDYGLLTLTFENNLMDNETALRYIFGEILLNYQVFFGEVEEINKSLEQQQSVFEIQGRNTLSKLVDIVVNKNTIFSEDIIYSTNSPTNTLVSINLGGRSTNDAVGGSLKTAIATNSSAPVAVGDRLFTQRGFIGEVSGLSSHFLGAPLHQIDFETGLLSTVLSSDFIYIENEKNYMFSKALGSSNFANTSPTSLTGSASKGLIFTAGNTIDSNGAEVSGLPNTSSNSNQKAIGYEINSPKNIKSDNNFECLLKDEMGNGTKSTFDTVNTLIDFEVVSVSKKDNVNQIELAPYIPITLGRAIDFQGINDNRIEQEMELAFTVTNNASQGQASIQTTNTASGFSKVKIGEPLFANNFDNNETETFGFIGYVLDIKSLDQKANHISSGNPASDTTTHTILLDRTSTSGNKVFNFDVNDEIYVSTRNRNHINLINNNHLWGGKIISIPHHKHTSSGLVPFNAYRSATTDFTSEFGNPYYKIINSDSFRLGTEPTTFNFNFNLVNFSYAGTYSGRKSKSAFNQTAYKFKPRINNTITIDEMTQRGSGEEIPYDKRGNNGVYGSKMTAQRRMHRDTINSAVENGFRTSTLEGAKHHLFQSVDDSFPRLFFYVNSDLLPYSSLRTDSIFHVNGNNATKTLKDYKLLLLEDKKITDVNNNLILKDDNLQSVSFTTDNNITQLKRFGLMRLTECVFDEYFNLINPEKSVNEIYSDSPNGFNSRVFRRTTQDEGSTTLVINTINSTSIVFTSSVSLIGGDEIFTLDNKFVGTISNTGSGTTHNITGNTFTPDMDTTTNRNAFRITDAYSAVIGGRKNKDSLFGEVGATNYHPLKGAIVPNGTGKYDYGANAGDTIRIDNGGTALNLISNSEVILPSVFGSSNTNRLLTNANYGSQDGAQSHVIEKLVISGTGRQNPHGGTIGVVLDTYPIEDSSNLLSVGNNTDVLGSSGTFRGGLNLNPTVTNMSEREIVALTSVNHYKQFLSYVQGENNTLHDYTQGQDDTRSSPADGAFIGFKLRLFDSSWSENQISSSNGTLYEYTISLNGAATGLNSWIELVDLTGCYLVAEKDSGTLSPTTIGDANLGLGRTTDPIYVYSHEPNSLYSNVKIITSASLSNNMAYRIMQPNPICLYSFHPNEIHLNTLRPEYTKKANEDSVYGKTQNNYFYYESDGELSNEAVLSMFVAVDLDNKSGGGNIITTKATTTNLLPAGNYEMYISDGENSVKTALSSLLTIDQKHAIVLDKKETIKGIASFSETFIVESLDELEIDPNRACIGSTVTITNETEELVDELLRLEDINFTITPENYPIYASADFQGSNLFNVLNYLLHLKDKKIVNVEGQIKVINYDDTDFNAQYSFTDDDVTEIKTTKSNFNYFNEVIVYGKNHKAIRKDFREIKKKGKKTLEIFEDKLTIKEDVEREAQEKLIMHTQLQELIECKIPVSKIKCLDVGETIILQSQVAGIEPRPFLILEKIQSFDGLVQLKLGKYIKGIEDMIADLLLDTKQTKSYIRNKSFNVNENAFDFFDGMKINEMHLLIRKKASTGSNLGFRTTLNTNTTPMGFAAGTITFTTLVEEDL